MTVAFLSSLGLMANRGSKVEGTVGVAPRCIVGRAAMMWGALIANCAAGDMHGCPWDKPQRAPVT